GRAVRPLGEGRRAGTLASGDGHGAALSLTVTRDAARDEPALVTMQRGRGPAPERGARVSLDCEADDVVLISP
ncbi:2-aminoethylphosphonate ABC transport system ATP-binding subunit PhnT, partial [Burkholderia pseudomallei]